MNNQEINSALAVLFGHKLFRADGTNGMAWCGGCGVKNNGGVYIHIHKNSKRTEPEVRDLPNYVGSLDVIVPAIRSSGNAHITSYVKHLLYDVGNTGPHGVFAAPHQHAQAFLMANGEWFPTVK